MREAGCIFGFIVITAMAIYMFPKVVIPFIVLSIIADQLDRRLMKRREQMREMDEEIKIKEWSVDCCRDSCRFSETTCRIFKVDKETDKDFLLSKESLEKEERELQELKDKRERMKKTSFFKNYEM